MPFQRYLHRDDQLSGDVGVYQMHPLGSDDGMAGNIVKASLGCIAVQPDDRRIYGPLSQTSQFVCTFRAMTGGTLSSAGYTSFRSIRWWELCKHTTTNKPAISSAILKGPAM